MPAAVASAATVGWWVGRFDARVVLLYGAARVLSALALALVAPTQAPAAMTDGQRVGYFGFTRIWDGEWYQRIADHGYPTELPRDARGAVQQNPWAFYPLFPLLARGLMVLTGLPFAVVASTLALVLGVAAAVVMARLLAERVGETGALLAVGLYAVFPSSPALQVCYTESLAMLLVCSALLALTRERWLLAGGLALLLGVTRPIALPLAIVVAVALWSRWRERTTRPLGRGEALRGVTALAACGVAGLLWAGVAWAVTGERDAYVATMGAWALGGRVRVFEPWLTIPPAYLGEWGLPLVGATIALLVAGVAGPWAQRLGPVLRTWPLGYAAYVMAVQTPGTSLPRYLLPMFPYLVVLLGIGWRTGRPRLLPTPMRAAVLGVAFLWLQWQWITVLWHFTPPTDWAP